MTAYARAWTVPIAVVVLTVAALGCKGHSGENGGGSGSTGEGANPTLPHRAGNCPSTVARSVTSAAIDGGNVVVTITSEDAEAITGVQKRTDELLAGRIAHHADTATQHQQNGEHGGAIGMCPIYIPEGATATAKHVDNGVVVSIATPDPAALKAEIDGRIQKAADWERANMPLGDKGTQGALGGGRAHDGMNHSGKGDGKGMERKRGNGQGGGLGTGGGGGGGTGGGDGNTGSAGSGSSATP